MLRHLTTALFLSCYTLCADSTADTKGLDVRLISETSAIVPGRAFTVGLHIRHNKGFHTYWKNPGIVGLPTSLEWKLPPGFTASRISWPYPERSSMAGHPCHGYERDVTLLVIITPPRVIGEKAITLSTVASWMCCAKNCYPDTKPLTLRLGVSDAMVADPSSAKLIQQSRDELPMPSPDWKAFLLSSPDDKLVRLRLKTTQQVSPNELYLFSCDGQISSELQQKFIKQSDGSLLLTIARSDFAPKNPTHLPAILKSSQSYIRINPAYAETK